MGLTDHDADDVLNASHFAIYSSREKKKAIGQPCPLFFYLPILNLRLNTGVCCLPGRSKYKK